MKFGIICEGITDFHVIKNVIYAYFGNVTINPIQPILDARQQRTDGYGGWELVADYLKSDKFEDAVAYNNYLVIQIDTDVCEHPKFNAASNSLAVSDPNEFYDLIKVKLIQWIDSYLPDTYDHYKGKIIFAICIHSIECWLLVHHRGTHPSKEKITGCLKGLKLELDRKGITFNPHDKKAIEYIHISNELRDAHVHPNIYNKSYSFKFFVYQLLVAKNFRT